MKKKNVKKLEKMVKKCREGKLKGKKLKRSLKELEWSIKDILSTDQGAELSDEIMKKGTQGIISDYEWTLLRKFYEESELDYPYNSREVTFGGKHYKIVAHASKGPSQPFHDTIIRILVVRSKDE